MFLRLVALEHWLRGTVFRRIRRSARGCVALPVCNTKGLRNIMEWLGIVLLVIALFLITQRWFWVLVFFFAGLASLFAMIASIIHFQILGALGFFVLMAFCFGILWGISDG